MTTKRIEVRGISTVVDDVGRGEPVVLVHGFPLGRALWDPLREMLADGCRVVTYDLRHHGETGGPDVATSMEDFAADLVALMDALDLRRAAVGGLSMGGYAILQAARTAAERFRALLLFDTRATPDTEEARAGRFETAARVRRDGPDAFVGEFVRKLVSPATWQGRPEVVEAVRSMARRSTAAGIARTLEALADRPSYVEILPAIDVPTLVVVGEDDGITPPAMAELIAAGVRGSKLVTVPQAGHVSPIERPDLVGPSVAGFLRDAGILR
jgi:pimeloyl-ACP methyl ester carboxylesterase